MKGLECLFCVLAVASLCVAQRVKVPDEERRSDYWLNNAQKGIFSALRMRKIEHKAKNVIMFLGDGMGMTTVTATRIYKGQKKNKGGEDELLTFDEFPYVSLSKTYGIDRQTSDSANTATAYLCGVKANYGTIGLDGRVEFENCQSSLDNSTHVTSILKWAQDQGLATGVVTSTRVTHATPAGTYAHTASRNWEGSSPDPRCPDIAQQLVHQVPGKNIKVILGGGRKNFFTKNHLDTDGSPGARNDSRNLVEEWIEDKENRNAKARAIFSLEELKSVNTDNIDFLLGLFHPDHMPYVSDRPELNQEYPTLPQMTELAIKVLMKEEKGFFLLVEGGKIDMAHHMNWGRKALEEGVEFDRAIETALSMTDEQETLVVVTADHSHTFTVGGDYPLRGSDIVGLGGVSDIDNKTFTTLGYHNGPGYKKNSRDRNLTQEEAVDKDFRQDALLPMAYETHGAEDVPVYAKGPMAHLFHGVHDQSYIPYVMGYAACVGPNQELCSGSSALVPRTTLQVLLVAFVNYVFTHIRTLI